VIDTSSRTHGDQLLTFSSGKSAIESHNENSLNNLDELQITEEKNEETCRTEFEQLITLRNELSKKIDNLTRIFITSDILPDQTSNNISNSFQVLVQQKKYQNWEEMYDSLHEIRKEVQSCLK